MGRRPLLVDRPGRPLALGPLVRRPGPGGHARRRAPRGGLLRLERLPRPDPAPGGEGRGHRRDRALGHGRRCRPPDRRLPPGAPRARAGAGRVEGHRGGAAVPHRLRRQPRRAHHLRHRRACASAPTSSTTPRSSTGAGWPRADVAVYRHADAEHLRRARSAGPTAGRRHGRDRHRVLDGRRRGPDRRRSSSCARRHGALLVLDEAHAVLGPSPSDRRPASTASTCCGSARCRRRSARSAGSSPAPRRFVDLIVNRARPFIFTTALDPGRHRGRPGRAAASCARRRATRCGPAARATSTASRPGHPSPIVPSSCGDERRRRRPRSTRCSSRACWCPPSGRPPSRRALAAAGGPVGRPHRRAGRPAGARPGRPGCARRRRERARARPAGRGARHRHRGRQDVGGVPRARSRCAAGAYGSRPASRCSPSSPATPTTDADVLAAATGEDRDAVCPPAPLVRGGHGPADGRRRPRSPAVHLADLVDELAWPDGVEVGLVETAGGVRSPMAADDADGVALAAALMPDVVVLVADAGLGTINSIRLAVTALEDVVQTRDAARPGGGAQPLRSRRRAAPAQPGLARGARSVDADHLDRGAGRRAAQRLILAAAGPPRWPGSSGAVDGRNRTAGLIGSVRRSPGTANVARRRRPPPGSPPKVGQLRGSAGPKDNRYQRF